jgi:hypothetical protein
MRSELLSAICVRMRVQSLPFTPLEQFLLPVPRIDLDNYGDAHCEPYLGVRARSVRFQQLSNARTGFRFPSVPCAGPCLAVMPQIASAGDDSLASTLRTRTAQRARVSASDNLPSSSRRAPGPNGRCSSPADWREGTLCGLESTKALKQLLP